MLQQAYVTLLLAVALLPAPAAAQLVINEASSRNARTLPNAAGEYHDWIEIHNARNTAVDLVGHTLSDDPLDPTRWTFPAVSIPAQGQLIVFCRRAKTLRFDGNLIVINVQTKDVYYNQI